MRAKWARGATLDEFEAMTDTPPSIRQRLARALMQHDVETLADWTMQPVDFDLEWRARKSSYLAQVDAILSELQEPSEGMLDALRREISNPGIRRDVWRKAIQHIRDGGR